jgi:hypothetical protein
LRNKSNWDGLEDVPKTNHTDAANALNGNDKNKQTNKRKNQTKLVQRMSTESYGGKHQIDLQLIHNEINLIKSWQYRVTTESTKTMNKKISWEELKSKLESQATRT